ncbi:hypothetical protein GCM10029978_064410 [Actinoallomurus acanthiterrae]
MSPSPDGTNNDCATPPPPIGEDILTVRADVARTEEIDTMFSTVTQALGRIDVLFINAGLKRFQALDQATKSSFDEIFDTNTRGAERATAVALVGARSRTVTHARRRVGWVDRRVASGADRVQDEALFVDGGQPVEGIGHEALGAAGRWWGYRRRGSSPLTHRYQRLSIFFSYDMSFIYTDRRETPSGIRRKHGRGVRDARRDHG